MREHVRRGMERKRYSGMWHAISFTPILKTFRSHEETDVRRGYTRISREKKHHVKLNLHSLSCINEYYRTSLSIKLFSESGGKTGVISETSILNPHPHKRGKVNLMIIERGANRVCLVYPQLYAGICELSGIRSVLPPDR